MIHAPRKKAWDFPTDPNQIGQYEPGVEKMETIEELKKYRRVVSVGPGSVKTHFSANVEILDSEESNCAKRRAHGTATGSVKDAVSEMSTSNESDNSTHGAWTEADDSRRKPNQPSAERARAERSRNESQAISKC